MKHSTEEPIRTTVEAAANPPKKAETGNAEKAMLYCPNCSQRLEGFKCKLFCRACGYYMSCADYY